MGKFNWVLLILLSLNLGCKKNGAISTATSNPNIPNTEAQTPPDTINTPSETPSTEPIAQTPVPVSPSPSPTPNPTPVEEPVTPVPSDPVTDPCAETTLSSTRTQIFRVENTFLETNKWTLNFEKTDLPSLLLKNPPTLSNLQNKFEKQNFTMLINNQCEKSISLLRDLKAHQALDSLAVGPKASVFSSVNIEISPNELNSFKKDIQENECVLGIQDNIVFKTRALDPSVKDQGHLGFIKALETQSKFFNTKNGIKKDVIIAVIDSGVDLNHEEFKNQLWTNPGESGVDSRGKPKENNRVDDDKDGYVDNVYGWNFADRNNNPGPGNSQSSIHGTHVAGLAAANGSNGRGGQGVMSSHIKVMALNVFGSSEGANTSDIDSAIRFAADHGADVINMSLGGPGYSRTTEAAIKYALNKDVFVVVAAGNDSSEISTNKNSWSFDTPASFGALNSGMLAVASLDSATGSLSNFSNYGKLSVEVATPGSENSQSRKGLYSSVPNGKYMRMEGTSMASPVLAGAISLMKGLLKSRNKVMHVNAMEELFLQATPSKTNLLSKIKGGKSLDLEALYREVDRTSRPKDECVLD